MKPWYPRKPNIPTEFEALQIVMRDAYKEGYSPKQIADYFKLSLCSVYNKMNLKGWKKSKRFLN